MIRVNTAEMQLFGHCVEMLFDCFLDQKHRQFEKQTEISAHKFRVPLTLYVKRNGKKFFIYTRVGEIQLSPREVECLQCLVDGLSAKETGSKIFLSPRTVETYLNNIKDKMNCRTKRDLIRQLYFD